MDIECQMSYTKNTIERQISENLVYCHLASFHFLYKKFHLLVFLHAAEMDDAALIKMDDANRHVSF
jgi:hypothetical protein